MVYSTRYLPTNLCQVREPLPGVHGPGEVCDPLLPLHRRLLLQRGLQGPGGRLLPPLRVRGEQHPHRLGPQHLPRPHT